MRHLLLAGLFLCSVADVAHAQPKICGNQAALGSWSLAACPVLRDDGVAPDESAGDGVYTASVQLSATELLEYKLLPTGIWDGSVEWRQVGTCPYDGGSKPNDTQNIQVPGPDVSRPTLFFYDSRALSDSGYSPAPGNRSGGDSAMIAAPAGSCPAFLSVGDFQNLYGANSSAVKLSLQGKGVLVGRWTATRALAAGWRWKVMQETAGVAREFGPSGWAYAPCQAAFATVSTPVSVGDNVYFLFHAYTGRLQTLVSASPLDGFTPDGGACLPPPDMAGGNPVDPALDLGGVASDLLAPGTPGSDASSMKNRPGIHCDCQMGRGSDAEPLPRASLLLILGMGAAFYGLRRQLGRIRFTAAKTGC
jgi:hypothetical protein